MKFKLTIHCYILIASVLLVSSCQNGTVDDADQISKIAQVNKFNNEITTQWYDLFLEIDQFAPGYRPPAAARMLGYVGLAAYEAVVPGMPSFRSLSSNYKGLSLPAITENEDYHWPSVLNKVYYQSFKNFFPHINQEYLDKMKVMDKKFTSSFGLYVSQEVIVRSAKRGQEIADAVYNWSETDLAGHDAYKNPQPSSYIPPKGPGKWQSTSPDFGKALFPYWGQVRTFALSPTEILGKPVSHYVGEFSEDAKSPFFQQAKEIYDFTNPKVFSRQWIAEFWSDDIAEQTFEPSARWVSIANQIIIQQKSDLETSIFLYAKLGMAMSDAAVSVWNTKFTYNLERPVNYIRRLIDPAWNTTLDNNISGLKGITPPFPAYPSGHAGFGAAAAGIFNSIYGSNYEMTDKSHEYTTIFNGSPRTFKSFDDMALENAHSRIYLGVHYRMDCEEGLELGYKAAQKVNDLKWK